MANKREARRNNVHPLFPPAALTSLKLSFLMRHALRQTASGGLKAEAGEWIKVAVKYLFPPAALTSLKLSFLLRHALRQTASGGLTAEAGE